MMNYNELENDGRLLETTAEGTCQLWECGNNEYVVLSDNTVITREEDLACDPIFPA